MALVLFDNCACLVTTFSAVPLYILFYLISLVDLLISSYHDLIQVEVVLFDSLNGTDINMPEWMFSKMIRSAKIKYRDHSIVRLIQILGKLGNWRRVLQVIEWLQMRERFKPLKLRYYLFFSSMF